MAKLALVFGLGLMLLCGCASTNEETKEMKVDNRKGNMPVGAFSVSLAVKDIAASRAFYEKLGFEQIHGDQSQNWLILQNGAATIGLFQGMFENNIMTFNPGWDNDLTNHPTEFVDVRDIQSKLQAAGIEPVTKADPESDGPANFVIVDPDGNTILFDQHVPKP